MNEWLKESPDPTSSQSQTSSPVISKPEETPAGDFYSSAAAKSFATLVQAANTVSNICDSPPQKDKKNAASGSAKKRWLRQAISEECDSPNSRPESPPSTLAPPKKRRFARENLSSDNYTPPTTPTMSGPDGSVHRNSLAEVHSNSKQKSLSKQCKKRNNCETNTKCVFVMKKVVFKNCKKIVKQKC